MRITPLFPRTAAESRARRPPEPDEAAAAVRLLNQQYIDAARAHDAGWFREHLADNVVVVRGNGWRAGKAEFLAMLKEESKRFRTLTVRDVRLRVFGQTVQVDADAPWELDDGSTGVSRYIDTYAWMEGRWQVISAQITPLPASAADR